MYPKEESHPLFTGKFVIMLILIPIAIVMLYFLFSLYSSFMNTPERVAASTMQNLHKGNVDPVFVRISQSFKSQNGEAETKELLQSFNGRPLPKLMDKEEISNTLGPYSSEAQPHRFVYTIQEKDKTNALILILYKAKNEWVIDGVYVL